MGLRVRATKIFNHIQMVRITETLFFEVSQLNVKLLNYFSIMVG